MSVSQRGLPFTDAVVGKLQFASGRVLHSGSMQLQQNGGRREDPVYGCCCAIVRCSNHSWRAADLQLVRNCCAAGAQPGCVNDDDRERKQGEVLLLPGRVNTSGEYSRPVLGARQHQR